MWSLENVICERKLNEFVFFSIKKGRRQENKVIDFKCKNKQKRLLQRGKNNLFSMTVMNRTKMNGCVLQQERFTLDMNGKYFKKKYGQALEWIAWAFQC